MLGRGYNQIRYWADKYWQEADQYWQITTDGVLVGGQLTFTGTLGHDISTTIGGNLTFNGTLGRVKTFIVSAGGSLTFFGSLQALNPDWLLIPDYLNWVGVWDSGTTYGIGDAVLYVEGDRPFAFASKAGSNLNHLPSDKDWWYRILPETWGKV